MLVYRVRSPINNCPLVYKNSRFEKTSLVENLNKITFGDAAISNDFDFAAWPHAADSQVLSLTFKSLQKLNV